ncbi:MAG: UMF1 family MFS transporter [Bacteroidia bacterium]|jgi:UMF1 family MFS transporter
MIIKNDPKIISGWTFYDWANSVYNLVITSVVFPKFFLSQTEHIEGLPVDTVLFFGREFNNVEIYSYVFSASFIVVSFLVPLLSGIADYLGNKKRFMQFFCYLGALSCMSMFFFDVNNLEISMLSPFFASIGFWGSLVFYNSYLPEIATPDRHDRISAKGFSMGYVGSILLLISVIVAIKLFPDAGDLVPRLGFIAVGLWWAGFAQITYLRLPNNVYDKIVDKEKGYIYKGYRELNKVWKELATQVQLKRFLFSFFIYNMGVQTIMLLAVVFADQEINWPVDEVTGEADKTGLIVSIILIQLVAVVGALGMSRLSRVIGNISVIKITVVFWIGICVTAYFITEPNQFYGLAAGVGFVMGGIQSMSRSTYSKMLPETTDHASYFSFYDVLEKIGLIIGPFLFGYVTGCFDGNMRYSVVILGSIFVLGFISLFWVKSEKPEPFDGMKAIADTNLV